MVKITNKKIILENPSIDVNNLTTTVSNLGTKVDNLTITVDDLAITLDNLAAMCMREFTYMRETMATKEEMNKIGIRLDTVSEIVLDEHRPRIKALEKEVFLQ